MANSIEGGILEALLAHLAGLDTTPKYPIAWPNAPFVPTNGQPYLAVYDLPTDTVPVALANDGTTIYEGGLQVSVYWPVGEGLITAKDLAGAVAHHFARGAIIEHGGCPIVRIERDPVVAAPLMEDAWAQIPVSIYWRSYNRK